jgi:hypothetical protein
MLQGVLPHNPLVTHETDTRHLRDPAFLRGALRYRVARMLFTLQLRLRRCVPVLVGCVCLSIAHAWCCPSCIGDRFIR